MYNATTQTVFKNGTQGAVYNSAKWQTFPDGFYKITMGLSDDTDDNIFNVTFYQHRHLRDEFFEF